MAEKHPYYKTVLFPIQTPCGFYCSGPGINGDYITCAHFDNEGGHPTCDLDLDYKGNSDLRYDEDGFVKKPDFCKNLKETHL